MGEIKAGKTFKYAADRFFVEFNILTQGQRSPLYVHRHQERIGLYLIPFSATNPLKERWRTACEDWHDYILFQVNTGLRPDEAG